FLVPPTRGPGKRNSRHAGLSGEQSRSDANVSAPKPSTPPHPQSPAMRVHHLNCISSCPLGGRLMDARTPSVLQRGALACHCLLVETHGGLVLVDTGFGLRDVANPGSRLSRFFLALLSPDFREEMTAIRQIE